MGNESNLGYVKLQIPIKKPNAEASVQFDIQIRSSGEKGGVVVGVLQSLEVKDMRLNC